MAVNHDQVATGNPVIGIVTDSSCDLPFNIVQSCQVEIVPTYVCFGDRAFRIGVDLTADEFVQRLPRSPVWPTTEPPSASDFQAIYGRLLKTCDHVISIHLSSQLGGTYRSALAARYILGHPHIHVIDSASLSSGLGLVVWMAARAAQENQAIGAILQQIEAIKATHLFYFFVDSLEYMHRSGRAGIAGVLAGILRGMKPILVLQQGRLAPVGATSSRPKAITQLQQMVRAVLDQRCNVHLGLVHALAPDDARQLYDDLLAEIHPASSFMCEAGPVTLSHSGPGALGVALYGDRRMEH